MWESVLTLSGLKRTLASGFDHDRKTNEFEALGSRVDTEWRISDAPRALAGERLLRGNTCHAKYHRLTRPLPARHLTRRRNCKNWATTRPKIAQIKWKTILVLLRRL